jgi:hypothetical protein
LNFILIPRSNGPYAHFNSGRMSLPPTLDGKVQPDKIELVERVLVAHEMGHAIFDQSLIGRVRNWETILTLRSKLDQNQQLRRALQIETDSINTQLDSHLSAEAAAKLEARKKDLWDQRNQLTKQWREISQELDLYYPASNIDRAYHELFADLIAVLATNDLAADARVRQYSLIQPEYTIDVLDLKYRDFGSEIPVKGWNSHMSHTMLSPVRSYLGKKINARGSMTPEQKAEFVAWVLKSIVAEVIERSAPSAPKGLSVPDINQRLIDKLESQPH